MICYSTTYDNDYSSSTNLKVFEILAITPTALQFKLEMAQSIKDYRCYILVCDKIVLISDFKQVHTMLCCKQLFLTSIAK